ncbi:MAG TPA: prepilin peptidase [Caulobacteraceae bacterium]|jgi:prepilin peptidase CpaA
MALIDIARYAVAAVLLGLLTWASVSDIKDRKIPNTCVLAVLGLFVVSAAIERGSTLVSALEAGGIAFAVTFALYYFNVIGAGDCKLFAAVALFAGLNGMLLFTLATVFAGGGIAAVSLATRPRRALVMYTLKGKGDFGRGIPYGVAIAIGGVVTVWAQLQHYPMPSFTSL